MTATIVGIGLFPEEVVQDDTDRSALMLLTPAYTRKALPYVQYEWQGLVLRRGDRDVDAFKQRYVGHLEPGSPQFFRVTSVTTFHTQQAVRPLSIALALFGAIAFLAGVVLVGLGLSRQLRSENEEREVLRAMGAAPAASSVAAATGPLVAVLAGAALAVVLAIAASPSMPIGKVRAVEVARGFDTDWTVLGFGALLLVALLGTVVGFTAWRASPHRGADDRPGARPSKLVTAAQGAGLSPAGVAGVRLAMEPGHGRTAVPVRSVMLGVGIAVLALVAATTFGSSLNALVDRPHLFGWAWDATLVDSSGYGNARLDVAHKVLDRDPGVDAWAGAFFGTDELDGTNVPLLGVTPGASVHPPILEGRSVESAHEIVLGSETLRKLGKDVGDTVTIGDGAAKQTLRIVGTATLPTIGIVHGAYTSLGVGAMVDTTLVPGYARAATTSGVVGPNVIFVRFREDVDHAATLGAASASLTDDRRHHRRHRRPRRTASGRDRQCQRHRIVPDDSRRRHWSSRPWRHWRSRSDRRSAAAATTWRCSRLSGSPDASWRRRSGGRRASPSRPACWWECRSASSPADGSGRCSPGSSTSCPTPRRRSCWSSRSAFSLSWWGFSPRRSRRESHGACVPRAYFALSERRCEHEAGRRTRAAGRGPAAPDRSRTVRRRHPASGNAARRLRAESRRARSGAVRRRRCRARTHPVSRWCSPRPTSTVWSASSTPYGPPNLATPSYRALADDKVRVTGEPLAIVVAETRALAEDACELVEVDIDTAPGDHDDRGSAGARRARHFSTSSAPT